MRGVQRYLGLASSSMYGEIEGQREGVGSILVETVWGLNERLLCTTVCALRNNLHAYQNSLAFLVFHDEASPAYPLNSPL